MISFCDCASLSRTRFARPRPSQPRSASPLMFSKGPTATTRGASGFEGSSSRGARANQASPAATSPAATKPTARTKRPRDGALGLSRPVALSAGWLATGRGRRRRGGRGPSLERRGSGPSESGVLRCCEGRAQLGEWRFHALVTLAGILREAPVHDVLELGGERAAVTHRRLEPRGRVPQDGGERVHRLRPLERGRAGEHLVEHRSEAEDVRPVVDLLTSGLFGGHVGERAHHHARFGQRRCRRPRARRQASPSGSISFARPKSMILIWPSSVTMRFPGFRSRWTMPLLCA